MKYLKQYPLSILCALAIAYLSIRSINNLPKISINHFDKFAHCLAYFVLMAIVLLEKRKTGNPNLRFLVLSGIFVIAYGLLFEFIQGALPTRQFDLYDMAANSSGCLLALMGFSLLTFKRL